MLITDRSPKQMENISGSHYDGFQCSFCGEEGNCVCGGHCDVEVVEKTRLREITMYLFTTEAYPISGNWALQNSNGGGQETHWDFPSMCYGKTAT